MWKDVKINKSRHKKDLFIEQGGGEKTNTMVLAQKTSRKQQNKD